MAITQEECDLSCAEDGDVLHVTSRRMAVAAAKPPALTLNPKPYLSSAESC